MAITPTPITTHQYLIELARFFHGNKRIMRPLYAVRPLDQSETFTINDYTRPVPLGPHIQVNRSFHPGESKVIVFHETGQMVDFDSYDGKGIEFYSLDVQTNEDIHMHYWFDGVGGYLGNGSPIKQYQEDPANHTQIDCSILVELECTSSPFCAWDTTSSACYCADDTNFDNDPASNTCKGVFDINAQGGGQWRVQNTPYTLPYIVFIRGDGIVTTKLQGQGSYNISTTTLDDEIDKIDPVKWDDWEIDPYANCSVRPWGVPDVGSTALKSMAAYKTIKKYDKSYIRNPVTGKMTLSTFKFMKEWKAYKDNQTE